MSPVVVNPVFSMSEQLRCLNACFRGVWSEASVEWYMRRPFDGGRPDNLVLYDADQAAAGLGINYRQLRLPDGTIAPIGVVTAAWTLAQFRGRAFLQRLIGTALDQIAERGCRALISFVVASNPSATTLRRFDAVEVPSRYIRVPRGSVIDEGSDDIVEVCDSACIELSSPTNGDAIAFHYPSGASWRNQFLERAHPTELLRIDGCMAVVELTDDTDRLIFLHGPKDAELDAVRACMQRALAAGRHFFAYTTRSWADRISFESNSGLAIRHGNIVAIPVPGHDASFLARTITSTPWHVHGGDRM